MGRAWSLLLSASLLAALESGCGRGSFPPRAPSLAERDVGGFVFDDKNDNGRIDVGESGKRGLVVTITNPLTGHESTTRTDHYGSFRVAAGAIEATRISVSVPTPPIANGGTPVIVNVERAALPGKAIEIAISGRRRSCEVAACSGLLLPDLVSLRRTPIGLAKDIADEYPGPDRWTIDTATKPAHRLLRVATISANIGSGPLVLGSSSRTGESGAAVQRIFDERLGYIDVPSGKFVLSASHGHTHLDSYQALRLVRSGSTVAQTGKISFCITDVFPRESNLDVLRPVAIPLSLFDCSPRVQGINVEMADYYGPALAEQYLDVTGVPPGRYELQIVTDPEGRITESNETNNSVSLEVDLPS